MSSGTVADALDHGPDPLGITVGPAALAYETALQQNPRWALSEGSRHFEEQSALFQTLHGIAQRLDELQIPYDVLGGMALFRHGLRRFTEDVDILVTKPDLLRIHEALDGRGYLPPFAKSKNLRDTQYGVRIEFLTTGDYPGDGKPKPVSFPNPTDVSFEADGVRYIKLETLVELKLASGMTNLGRLKDLSDVLELIKTLNLSREFSESLNPYVREKYLELWQQGRRRYVMRMAKPQMKSAVTTFDDMIEWFRGVAMETERTPQLSLPDREANARLLRDSASLMEQLRRDGVAIDEERTASESVVYLVTTDPQVAEKHGFVEESELWDTDGLTSKPSP